MAMYYITAVSATVLKLTARLHRTSPDSLHNNIKINNDLRIDTRVNNRNEPMGGPVSCNGLCLTSTML